MPALLDDLLQGLALDVFHGNVRSAAEPAPRQEPDDVGMAELLEDLGLALEPVADFAPLGKLAAHDLHGGGPLRVFVCSPVDNPHGARAQYGLDAERAELLAD